MKTKKIISVNTPLITKNDAIEVYKIVKSGWISSAGSKITEFEKNENDNNNINEIKKDKLYSEALKLVKLERKASTSFFQRKLQIGYNRAARIVDMMEQDGIISQANHVGKREIL